jgi:hypothetical protein
MKREEALEVYKIQHERFRQTKELQWKINLASWALIALAITYSDKLSSLSAFQVCTFSSIFFIAQMIFSWRTQRALEADKEISKHILNELGSTNDEDLSIDVNVDKLTKKIKIRSTGRWWLAFQALTTGILLLAFVMITICKH